MTLTITTTQVKTEPPAGKAQTFASRFPAEELKAPYAVTTVLDKAPKGGCQTVSPLTRVGKPLIRWRVTVALLNQHAMDWLRKEFYGDQYVVAPTAEAAAAHAARELGVDPERYQISVLELED